MNLLLRFGFTLLFLAARLPAQGDSRAGQIEAERESKARHLTTTEERRWKHALHALSVEEISDFLNSSLKGFRVRFGGLPPGAGFAMGPEYRRIFWNDEAIFHTSFRGTLQQAYLADVELEMPQLVNRHVFVDFYAARSDFPQFRYYGPDASSQESSKTDYRLENTALTTSAGVRLVDRLKLGVEGRYLYYNVGPGISREHPSTDKVFGAEPGVTEQTDFLQLGPFLQFDYRDRTGMPSAGGNYILRYSSYSDRRLHQFAFTRVEGELQQYVPFFNERRVIALRAKSVISEPHAGQVVPFYVQPTLGGSHDLRGFPPFRFYGNNSFVMNGEYLFEVVTGLRMAVFMDAGKVFPRWQQLNFSRLEKNYGFGFRGGAGSGALRLDFGFSREGVQAWLVFDNVF